MIRTFRQMQNCKVSIIPNSQRTPWSLIILWVILALWNQILVWELSLSKEENSEMTEET